MRPDGVGDALVVSVGRNAVWIAFDDESWARLAMLRKQGERVTLAPGDRVEARPIDDDRAIVDRRAPRTFELVRRTALRSTTMAANIDTLAIVTAFANPPLDLPMLDELLAFGEREQLPTIIFFTKPDLVAESEAAAATELYRSLGYEGFVLNPKAGVGVVEVAARLAGHRTLLIGRSGVGKSSLFRALGGDSVIGELSKTGHGRQTTTSSRLLRFEAGFLIDSPGVGQFALHDLPISELAHAFVEVRARAAGCRFADCTHRAEPGCAIARAVAANEIAPSRIASYRIIAAREFGLH